MKTIHKLDKEELDILNAFETGKLKSIKNQDQEIKRYSGYAKESARKDRNLNIRISGRDLERLKNIAIDEGLPYQTFISSLLHKFINGRLVEKR
ncbi:MAG: antitoxin [Leptospira sp.]|nr:antitoxin [Leptospira sp.]